MWWTLQHGVLRRRAMFVGLIGLSAGSLAAQAAAVGVVFLYVRHMESGAPIPFLNLPESWAPSYHGLFTVVVLVGGLMAAAHLALHLTRMIGIDWGRDHEKYCGRLALAHSARLPDLSRLSATASATDAELRKLITMDVRYCGLTVRLMVLTVPTLVSLLGSIVVLLTLDWAITSFVMILGVVLFLFQYPFNLRGANATQRWQKARGQAQSQTLGVIERQRLGSPRLRGKEGPNGDFYSQPAIAQALEAYSDRMRAIESGTFAAQLGTTLLIAMVILFIGDRALRGDADWAFLIAFVGLLRVASSNFSGLARHVNSIARLFPQVQNFVRFIRAATAYEVPAPLRGAAWGLRLSLRNGTKDRNGAQGVRTGSAERLVLRNDEAVALVCRGARSDARPDFAITLAAEVCPTCSATGAESTDGGRNATAEGGAAGGTSGAVVLVATGRLWAGSVPREALALAADLTPAGWRTALDRLREARPDLDEEIKVCAGMDFNKPADGSEGGCRTELVAQFAAALTRRASVLIVERGALTALECSSAQDPLLALLKRERLVMVWYEQAQVGADFRPQFGERTLLVCTGTAVEAGVDLSAADSGERIETLLAGPLGKTGKARASVGAVVDDALFDQE